MGGDAALLQHADERDDVQGDEEKDRRRKYRNEFFLDLRQYLFHGEPRRSVRFWLAAIVRRTTKCTAYGAGRGPPVPLSIKVAFKRNDVQRTKKKFAGGNIFTISSLTFEIRLLMTVPRLIPSYSLDCFFPWRR